MSLSSIEAAGSQNPIITINIYYLLSTHGVLYTEQRMTMYWNQGTESLNGEGAQKTMGYLNKDSISGKSMEWRDGNSNKHFFIKNVNLKNKKKSLNRILEAIQCLNRIPSP